jgi:hypothetical protein
MANLLASQSLTALLVWLPGLRSAIESRHKSDHCYYSHSRNHYLEKNLLKKALPFFSITILLEYYILIGIMLLTYFLGIRAA